MHLDLNSALYPQEQQKEAGWEGQANLATSYSILSMLLRNPKGCSKDIKRCSLCAPYNIFVWIVCPLICLILPINLPSQSLQQFQICWEKKQQTRCLLHKIKYVLYGNLTKSFLILCELFQPNPSQV